MESAPRAIEHPPPPGRDSLASVVAWLMLGAAALAVVTLASRAAGSAGAAGRFSIVTDLAVALGAAAVACTAAALLRRRNWAAAAAIGEFVLASISCLVAGGMMARHPTGPPATDGASYAVLSAFMVGVALMAGAVLLALPSTRRRFHEPPAGWYADPAAEARWRWWNGQRWTAFTVS